MVDAGKTQILEGVDRGPFACLPFGLRRFQAAFAHGVEQCPQRIQAGKYAISLIGQGVLIDSVRNAYLEWRVAQRHGLPIL